MGIVNPNQPAEIECTECGGIGCRHCDRGYYRVTQCPQSYIGSELVNDINIVAQCTSGVMPVSGGLMNQPAYWLELKTRLEGEQNQIEREQRERKPHG
jgi:hypothetical protein